MAGRPSVVLSELKVVAWLREVALQNQGKKFFTASYEESPNPAPLAGHCFSRLVSVEL